MTPRAVATAAVVAALSAALGAPARSAGSSVDGYFIPTTLSRGKLRCAWPY